MNAWICTTLLVVGLGAATIARAQTDSTEERLRKLETQMQAVVQENLELRRKLGLDPVTNAPAALKSAGAALEVRLGGMLQVHGEFGDDGDARWAGTCRNDRVFIRRARVHLLGSFLEHVNFKLQGDFAGSLAATEGVKLSMTDGWINYNRFDWANFKVGQYYPSFGYEKRLDPMKLQVVELTLPTLRLIPDRQLGAQLHGQFLDRRLGYALGVFNGNNLNNNFNDNENFQVVPRLEGLPFKGRLWGCEAAWNLGLAAYYSDDAHVNLAPEFCPGTNYFLGTRLGLAVDTQFRVGPFNLAAEYLETDFDPVLADDFVARGWYVQAGYFIHPKWQGVLRYEAYDPSAETSDDVTRSWTFGVNYCLKGSSVMISANYLLMDTPLHHELQDKVLLRLQAEF